MGHPSNGPPAFSHFNFPPNHALYGSQYSLYQSPALPPPPPPPPQQQQRQKADNTNSGSLSSLIHSNDNGDFNYIQDSDKDSFSDDPNNGKPPIYTPNNIENQQTPQMMNTESEQLEYDELNDSVIIKENSFCDEQYKEDIYSDDTEAANDKYTLDKSLTITLKSLSITKGTKTSLISNNKSSESIDTQFMYNSNDDEEEEDEFEEEEKFIYIQYGENKKKEKEIKNEHGDDTKKEKEKEIEQQKGEKQETEKEEEKEPESEYDDDKKEEYDEYIKKHNTKKKKKKSSKKKKTKKRKRSRIKLKNKRSKSREHKYSPLVITESNSTDLWDFYDFVESVDKNGYIPYDENEEMINKRPKTPKAKKKLKLKKNKSLSKSPRTERMRSPTMLSPKSESSVLWRTTLKISATQKKLDPEYRKMQREKKEALNLSRMGFKIKTNHRYRIDDGRIGICKFRGRTAFAKPHEDWIGLIVEYGEGAHNGTVDGKQYFRCAQGKGIMVRPCRIIQDLGLPNGKKITQKMIRGPKEIRNLLEDIAFEKEQQAIYND